MFSRVMEWVNNPRPGLAEKDDRRRASLVSTMLFVVLAVLGIFLLLDLIGASDHLTLSRSVIAGSVVNYSFLFLLNRTRLYRVVPYLWISVYVSGVLYALATISDHSVAAHGMAWMVIPPLLGGLILKFSESLVATLLTTFAALIGGTFYTADFSETFVSAVLVFVVGLLAAVYAFAQKSKELTIQTQNQEIVQSSKLAVVGELAAEVMHDLNNPLMVVTATASKMKKTIESGQDLDREKLGILVTRILHSSEKIKSIAEGVLRHARKESGELNSYKIATLIQESLELLSGRIRHASVTVSAQVDPGLEIMGRGTELDQVFLNLIGNAVDAIEPLKLRWIDVDAKKDNDWVEIRVMNSGPKIPESLAEKIMMPFYTTKPKSKGTGLGLGIVRRIVQDHRGEFRLDLSGEFTTFVLRFPSANAFEVEDSQAA